MKKLVLLLLLTPLLSKAQIINSIQESSLVFIDTAIVYSESKALYFRPQVGNCLIAGGSFAIAGLVTEILTNHAINDKTAWRTTKIIGYICYGISFGCFIAAGVHYIQQKYKHRNFIIVPTGTGIGVEYKF